MKLGITKELFLKDVHMLEQGIGYRAPIRKLMKI